MFIPSQPLVSHQRIIEDHTSGLRPWARAGVGFTASTLLTIAAMTIAASFLL
jgi:hypothetical protein